MKLSGLKFLAPLLLLAVVPLAAQDPDHPPTKPQSDPAMSPREKKNLQLVLDWWAQVIQGHHVELYAKYQSEDFIEHSPNSGSGRAAFVKTMSARPPVNPMPKKLNPAPVITFAKDDYVTLVWEHRAADPTDPSKKYVFTTFDVLRIQDGKIQEHWDSSFKNPPAPSAER